MEVKTSYRVVVTIILLTILLSIPRFGHYVAPDSAHYVEIAAFFRGDLLKQDLRPPFVYRVLVPYLASLGPTNVLDLNMAAIGVVFTISAFIIFYYYLQILIKDRSKVHFGMLILIVAFPTVNYSSGVMTDAAGFFFFVLAVFLFLKKRLLPFTIAWTLGVMARDAILVLIVAILVYLLLGYFKGPRQDWNPKILFTTIPPVLAYLGIRWFFSDLPTYIWSPSLQHFLRATSRPIAWAVFSLTLLPPLMLLLLAFRRRTAPSTKVLAEWDFHEKALLFSLTIAGIMLNMYSAAAAALSGRFVWPFYLVLIPMVAAFYQIDSSRIFSIGAAVSAKIFGE